MTAIAPANRRLYAGLFTVSLATLMYEILLTRVFSVTMWYHFAFVAISLALFGMSAGAVIVYIMPERFRPERAPRELALSALWFSVTIVASFLTHLSIPFTGGRSIVDLYSIALTYTALAVPFVFSGICVCVALTRFPPQVERLYAADLAGAALGCVLLIFTLGVTDALTAVVLTAALAALAALFFAGAAHARRLTRAAAIGMACLVLGVLLNHWTAVNQMPLLHLVWAKGEMEGTPVYEKWNSFSRITIWGDPTTPYPPSGWGLSETYPPGNKVRQLAMTIDAGAATVLNGFDGDLAPMDFLQYDIINSVHYLRSDADVLVIGTGGGRDILSALVFDQRSVLGVEINNQILSAVNERFGDFTGHLDRYPNVTLVNDEARSYVTRTDQRFDIIQVSLIDTWAATASGAFVLTENSLYTVEAWDTFLDHLKPDGVMTFSRWYVPRKPDEMYRLTNLAVTALQQRGVTDPRAHIMILSYHQTQFPANDVSVGTMLISNEPFSDQDINTLEALAKRMDFTVVLTPRQSVDETFVTIAGGRDLAAFVAAFPADISAPTDNSPYFFLTMRMRDAFTPAAWYQSTNEPNVKAMSVLGGLVIVVVALTLLCILVPLVLTTQRAVLQGAQPLFLYFTGIGLGFMLIEVSQMQRLIVFLGHPIYSLSVVLFTLLLASGIGSFSTRSVAPSAGPRPVYLRLGLLLALLLVFGLLTPYAVTAFAGATTPVRIAVSVALLFPLGFFMGMAFPLGMRQAAARAPALTAWLWGINGAASVCASVFAMVIAIGAGISAAFWAGAACYVVAAASYAWSERRTA